MIESNISQSTNKLRISGIVEESIVDGPGIRFTVFTQGCSHNCKGCHNPGTHDYRGGEDILVDDIIKMVKENPLLDGITISGGEPFDQPGPCTYLARKVKELGLSVIVYTGYDYEFLLKKNSYKELLDEADLLVDGEFSLEEMDLRLSFKGSANQRIIDIKESLKLNKVCIA